MGACAEEGGWIVRDLRLAQDDGGENAPPDGVRRLPRQLDDESLRFQQLSAELGDRVGSENRFDPLAGGAAQGGPIVATDPGAFHRFVE